MTESDLTTSSAAWTTVIENAKKAVWTSEIRSSLFNTLTARLPYPVFHLPIRGGVLIVWHDNNGALNNIYWWGDCEAAFMEPTEPNLTRVMINYDEELPLYQHLKEEVWSAPQRIKKTKIALLAKELPDFAHWIADLILYVDFPIDREGKHAPLPPHDCYIVETSNSQPRYITTKKAWATVAPDRDEVIRHWSRSDEFQDLDKPAQIDLLYSPYAT
ncbi:MAG: hypothetical protein GY847_40545 [Proteobacteria bacterium]|nr:hypothetical protein [Pseudomonadota bacterium]